MEKSKLKGIWQKAAMLFISCLLAFTTYAQQKTLSGTVVGEDGGPIPGVTVVIKGTTVGIITDMDGKFSFSAPVDAKVLSVSYIGMKKQEITIGNQTNFKITLVADVVGVEEVIVTGYATQAKASLTGAISQVSAADLAKTTAGNAVQRLQGRVSGVTIINSHTPGGDPDVRVRGLGTINNNTPLYVVDGVPTKWGLSQLNPNEIESVTVLKDASSAAIYGARGANGVIIITTKRGSSGEPKISVDARFGVQQASKYYDMLNTKEWGELKWLEAKNDGVAPGTALYGFGASPVIPDYALAGSGPAKEGDAAANPALYNYDPANLYLIMKSNKVGTDWYDEILRVAPVQEYNISVSGGTTKGSYAFSAGYFSEDGILINTGFDRYSLRSNANAKFHNWLEVGESLGVSYTESKGALGDNAEDSPISQAYRIPPIIPVYDIEGNYGGTKIPTTGNGENPVAILERNMNDRGLNLRTIGNAYAKADIIKGLSFKTLFGFDYRSYNGRDIFLKNPEMSEAKPNDGLNISNNYTLQWNFQNLLTYNTTIDDIHKVNFMAGTEAVSSTYRYFNASRSVFFSTDPNYMYLDAGESAINNGGLGSDWKTMSYFARVNYDLSGRYLLEATFRRDGSSRFGSNNRWGNFPAFSAGWRISEESFMAASKGWLDDMKLRVGWGKTGNDEMGDYNGFTTFRTHPQFSKYSLTGSSTSTVAGFDSAAFGNPDAKWESTATTNIGLDLTLLDGNLTFNIDAWQRLTSDMLFPKAIPNVVGSASAPSVNVGEMKNLGVDFTAIYHGKAMAGDLKYTVTANLSSFTNEITKLSDNPKEFLTGANLRQRVYVRSEVGQAFPSYFGYQVDGIFQTQAEADAWPKAFGATGTYNEPGHFKYRDISGPNGVPDGVIDSNDRTYIGNPHPDLYGGLTLDIEYKSFDLTAFFMGSYGNEMINVVNRWLNYNVFVSNYSKDRLYNSWGSPYLKDNTKATLAKAQTNDSGSQEPSTHFIEDGSYLRLKTLQLGYNLPNNTLKKLGFTQLRVYFQASNLFTITKYSGLDPEVRTGNDRTMGVDQGAWPTPRQFMIGVNLGI